MIFGAAVIGCGRIGSDFANDPGLADDVFTHAEAYARCPMTNLIAVCDIDPVIAARCAERWGIGNSFTDAQMLFEVAAPEIVSICTPDETHFEIARLALKAPSVRAILCEKPIATSLEHGEELAHLARQLGKKVAVAYGRRYASSMIELRRFIKSGTVGRLIAAGGWYGKGVLHNGSHWFDLLRMLVGEIEWIEATDRLGDLNPDPTLDVTLGLRSGAVATLRATDCRHYTVFEMDLMMEHGRISILDSGHVIELFRRRPSARYSGYVDLVLEPHEFGDMRNMMLRAVEDLATALNNGRDPLCTLDDGLRALRIAMAAHRSARSGDCKIELKT